MTDGQWLAVLLGAVYLAECVVRVPAGALVLARPGGAFRVTRPAVWSDAFDGALVLDDPLPPLRGIARLQPWTVALSPEGVVCPAREGGIREARFVPWEGAKFSAHEREVAVNGIPVARLASAEAAERLAETLADIAATPPGEREKRIVAALDARLDADAAAARRKQWESLRPRVSISSNALFVITLAAIVGIAGAPVAEDLWLWFVAGAVTVVVLALVWTLLDFSYVHRRLDPDGDARRRHALLLLALSPIGAIRSAAAAGRDVYAAWDPLAVAHAHCDADEFRRVAQEALCELRHPPPRGDAADAAIRRCEEWTRSAQLASVERLLTARGLDPASLLAPPVPLRATNRAWCPRCRVQYEIPSGACADCGGVPLVAFEEASRAG